MYTNSSGAESGSYSLTFLGKKVGRHHSVAPAGKQRKYKTHQQLEKHLHSKMAYIHLHPCVHFSIRYQIICCRSCSEWWTGEVRRGLNISAAWLPLLWSSGAVSVSEQMYTLFLAGPGWRSGHEGRPGPREPHLRAHMLTDLRMHTNAAEQLVSLSVADIFCVVFQFCMCACVFTWRARLLSYIKTGLVPALCHCKLHHLQPRCFHYLKATALLLQLLFSISSTSIHILCYLKIIHATIICLFVWDPGVALSCISLHICTAYLNWLYNTHNMHHLYVELFSGAWETTNRSTCPEDPVASLRPGRLPVAAQVLQDLPGSVPELKDERPGPIIHNTQFDQYEDSTGGQTSRPLHTLMHTHTQCKQYFSRFFAQDK